MEIGDAVLYTDEYSREHNAVVTTVWSPGSSGQPSLNVVYVSTDENETDQYGRQIKRATSVPFKDDQGAAGRFWQSTE